MTSLLPGTTTDGYQWRVVDSNGRVASVSGLTEAQARDAAARWSEDAENFKHGPYWVQKRAPRPAWEDA